MTDKQELLDKINTAASGFCPAINVLCRIDCIARIPAEYEGLVDGKEQFASPFCNYFKTRLSIVINMKLVENVRFV